MSQPLGVRPFYDKTSMGEGWERNPVLEVQGGFLSSHLSAGEITSVLDLGCGHGTNSSVLFGDRPDITVVGLDISSRAVAAYKTLRPGVIGSAEALPFAPGCFDLVVSDDVVEHLVDTDAYAKEIRRVLRPGGYLTLSTPNLAAWFNRIALFAGMQPAFSEVSFERVFGRPGSDLVGHLRLFTSKATREFLDYHGFDLVDVKGAPFGALPRGATTIDRLLARSPSLAAITVVLARSRP